MVSNNDWYCWEITNCKKSDSCLAAKSPGVPCWQIAGQLDDYRSTFNVCKDCIVYLAKQGMAPFFSPQELLNILTRKEACVLAEELTLPSA